MFFRRHQLPVHNPLSPSALAAAFASLVRMDQDSKDRLSGLMRKIFGANAVFLLESGTQALDLAIRIAMGKRGSDLPVGLPAFSCYDLATAAVGADVPVRFFDLDPSTLSPSIPSTKRVLELGVCALVVSNLYGYPVPWDEIRRLCVASGTILIEDAAQALGTSWTDKPGGSFGDLTVLSFGRGKGWSGGGGGALLVRGGLECGPEARERFNRGHPLYSLSAASRTTVQWCLGRPSLFGIPSSIPWLALGETRYEDPSPLRNISRFSAELALRTVSAANAEVRERRENALRWASLLEGLGRTNPLSLLKPLEGGLSAYLRLPALIRTEERGILDSPALRRSGIRKSYPRPLPGLPVMASRNLDPTETHPGALNLAQALITLPTHSLLQPQDFETVRKALERRTVPAI